MKTLTPYQKKLIELRLSGLRQEQIAEKEKKAYGTIRNYFVVIHKILGTHFSCELLAAWQEYNRKKLLALKNDICHI
jgi:DNA-binding CsgD family transcriptional regulator